MKTAVLILSDPKSGSEESLGRLFNALAFAAESKSVGDEVAIVFNGAGTRWPEELTKLGHPAQKLYDSLRESVVGASCGCAEIFGADEGVKASGVPLLRDYDLPGTSGVSSLRRYADDGWKLFVF